MKPPELDQVAIWLPMKRDEIDVKVYDNYHYTKKGIVHSASSLAPVCRYAKNYYDKNKEKFSLCIISLEKNTKAMESFLDKVAKDITIDRKQAPFTKTGIHYGN